VHTKLTDEGLNEMFTKAFINGGNAQMNVEHVEEPFYNDVHTFKLSNPDSDFVAQ
jgi:hypothetical protein